MRLLATRRAVIVRRLKHVDILDAGLLARLDRRRQQIVDMPFSAASLGGSLLRYLFQQADGVEVGETAAHQPPIVRASDGTNRLDAPLGHGGVDRITAASANAEDADAILIDIRERHQIVHDMAKILDGKRRVLDEARLAAAGSLEAAVEGDNDEAFLGQGRPVDITGGLLLAATDGMGADDRRVFALFIKTWRDVQISGDFPVHVLVLKSYGLHEPISLVRVTQAILRRGSIVC